MRPFVHSIIHFNICSKNLFIGSNKFISAATKSGWSKVVAIICLFVFFFFSSWDLFYHYFLNTYNNCLFLLLICPLIEDAYLLFLFIKMIFKLSKLKRFRRLSRFLLFVSLKNYHDLIIHPEENWMVHWKRE